MHADQVVAHLRRHRRHARVRRALMVAATAISVASGSASAGLIEWWIDWWNRPSQPRQAPPIHDHTVRAIGGADA